MNIICLVKEKYMTKADLIAEFARATDLTKVKAAECLEKLALIMREELRDKGQVPLPRLGKLQVVQRAERCGRNPRTGEPVRIGPRKAVKFSAGKHLKACAR